MKKIIFGVLGLTLLAAGGWYAWHAREELRVGDVTAAYLRYDAAFRSGTPESLRPLMTDTKSKEFDEVVQHPELFQLAAGLRPADAKITGVRVEGSTASVTLAGTGMGGRAAGTIRLQEVAGAWKVDHEDWQVTGDLSLGTGSSAPIAPPPDAILRPAIKAIVDRIASADPGEGARAWMDLGARFQDPGLYLRETTAGFWDDRAVAFPILQESFGSGAKTFQYFTAGATPIGAAGTPAATVGEALRFHLWQLEGLSLGPQSQTFQDWWLGYASSHGLPFGWKAGR